LLPKFHYTLVLITDVFSSMAKEDFEKVQHGPYCTSRDMGQYRDHPIMAFQLLCFSLPDVPRAPSMLEFPGGHRDLPQVPLK
ncbi:hypothetical protein P7K49_026478, partial [Saguinus oedipus]